MKQLLFVFAALLLVNVFIKADTPVWQDASPGSFNLKGTVYLAPVAFRTVSLNKSAMYSILNSAPKETDVKVKNSNVIFSFPMPNGTISRFKIVESSVMEPEL